MNNNNIPWYLYIIVSFICMAQKIVILSHYNNRYNLNIYEVYSKSHWQ